MTPSPAPLTPTLQRFLTIPEAARRAAVSVNTIRRLLDSGKLTRLRPCPRRVVVDARELDEFVLGTAAKE